MPPANNKTFYEVLGIRRNAKSTDIERAYARIKADMQKETTAPNPRLAAMAKVAYETLSNPAKREAYDASLGIAGVPVRKGRGGLVAASLVVIVAATGAGYYFFARPGKAPAPQAAQGGALGPQEILQEVAPHLGRVQGALMSGEVRNLGTAVAVGENEMVTTCRGITAGMQLSVTLNEFKSKAEVARANEDLDICTLTVKGAGAGIKMRQGVPAAREKIQAVFLGPDGPAQARQVSVARALEDPKGPAVEVKAAAALPNGAALFDEQARLVGIVVTPHALGEGLVAALGVGRIAQARGAAPTMAAAAPTQPATPVPATASAPAASTPAPAAPTPATSSGGRGTLVEEGFSSLWREDSEGRFIEALDNIKKADVGNPLAYWTLWSGRDSNPSQVVHCRITGPGGLLLVDDDQISDTFPSDGYWYCAYTRHQVELDQIPEGQYNFEIFVNRRPVGEGSIRVEKRFFTRGTYAVIVLVVGLGLLAFLRRNKQVGVVNH